MSLRFCFALLSAAVVLAIATACRTDTDDAAHTNAQEPQSVAGVAPWDAGFERPWFFTRKRGLEDPLWERVTSLVGKPMPELALTEWRGDAVTPDDLAGKVVLVDFWATWCPDCRAAIPTVDALVERLADAPFEVISICAKKGGERYDEALSDWGIDLPTALDVDGTNETAYDVLRWPYYVLIDTDGTVRAAGIVTEHLDKAVDLVFEQERARGAL